VRIGTQRYLDAIEQGDFEVLHAWSASGAAVAIPVGWWEDHWNYPSMWDFISSLDVPIGLFQGEDDAMTPAEAVRRLEARAQDAGKSNLGAHYFPDLGHDLGLGSYFAGGALPPGHAAIFAFVRELAAGRR
jgi:alpha-beta hydrolase superfamily lysophospholipase